MGIITGRAPPGFPSFFFSVLTMVRGFLSAIATALGRVTYAILGAYAYRPLIGARAIRCFACSISSGEETTQVWASCADVEIKAASNKQA